MLNTKDDSSCPMPSQGVSWQRSIGNALVVLAALVAATLVILATHHGVGLKPDSTFYVEGARSLLAGKGYSAYGDVISHWPPGYSLVLAGIGGLFSGNVLLAARILAVILFPLNVILCALALRKCTEGHLGPMALAIAVLLTSPTLIEQHSLALSDSLFLAFLLATFLLLSITCTRATPGRIILLGLLAGGAFSRVL